MSNNNITFPRETIEKLLLKEIMTNEQCMIMVSHFFNKRWIKTKDLATLFNLTIAFYKKFTKLPDSRILIELAKGFLEKKNGGKLTDLDAINTFNSYKTLIADMNNLCKTLSNLSEEQNKAMLFDFIKKQTLYVSIIDNIEDIEKDADNVIEKCLSRFEEINKINLLSNDIGMNYSNQEDMDEHWDYIMNPEAKLSFGWSGFDSCTNGGAYKNGKFLGIFMGQAGLGKSLFLSNLAVNYLKQNLSVVVISLEMSENVYAQRFDAHISGNDINHLRTTHDDSRNKITAFFHEHPNAKLFIKEFPPRSVRCSEIKAYLDMLKLSGNDFDVIIVDYLNLVLPNTSKQNMYEDVREVAEKLRSLSYLYSVPVWTATQTNGNGINNESIGLEHVSESKGQIHTADFFVGLFQTEQDRENGIISARILKNRLGGRIGHVISMKTNDENLRLTDVGEPDYSSSDDSSSSDKDNSSSLSTTTVINASNIHSGNKNLTSIIDLL